MIGRAVVVRVGKHTGETDAGCERLDVSRQVVTINVVRQERQTAYW